ncbi:hypothetical protein K0M31_019375 [Melipona bicolor]|uniref:Uncharacterized protein n=1 Tax=Melipona bicolor TaxID=60889 RepID=A0AA40KR27_9HYME|nr:hypothetical protein K0M31_019375 [Melipona bicolor]
MCPVIEYCRRVRPMIKLMASCAAVKCIGDQSRDPKKLRAEACAYPLLAFLTSKGNEQTRSPCDEHAVIKFSPRYPEKERVEKASLGQQREQPKEEEYTGVHR